MPPGPLRGIFPPHSEDSQMQLTSVNIGTERTQPKGMGFETTGIYKLPARGSVEVTQLGIVGDFVADQANHGGPDQAVYVYGTEDYEWWSAALGRRLLPGTFGENLTVSGLASADFNIGDRLQIGSVILEVTAPRSPCGTFSRRMGDPLFVKKFRRAERPGLYCRVIQAGAVHAGHPVGLRSAKEHPVGVLELFRQYHDRHKDEAALRRFLGAPIAIRDREIIERELRRMPSRGSLVRGSKSSTDDEI